MTSLVRSPERHDDREDLRSRLAALDTVLGERRAEVASREVGSRRVRNQLPQTRWRLHEQLDTLELEIAEIELGELSRRIEDSPGGAGERPATVRPSRCRDSRLTRLGSCFGMSPRRFIPTSRATKPPATGAML